MRRAPTWADLLALALGPVDVALHVARAPRWVRRPVCDWIDNYLDAPR